MTWAVEKNSVFLFEPVEKTSLCLAYPEALVWDMISRERPLDSICRVFKRVSGMDGQDSDEFLNALFNEWVLKGIVVRQHG